MAGKNNEINIDTLQIEYNLKALLHGRVLAIHCTGALITSPWKGEWLSQSSRRILPSAVFSAFPFEDMVFSSSSILFLRDDTRFRIPFEAAIRRQQDHFGISLGAELLGGQTEISATISPQGALQRLTVSIRGLNPGLLPQPFLPYFFTAPLQGALNGNAQAILKDHTWKLTSDLNFRLSGELQKTPFSFQPARMELTASLNPYGAPQSLRLDLACEEALVARYDIRNFSANAEGDTQTLSAQISGNGSTWDFKNASAQITGYPALLKQLLHKQAAAAPPPHLHLMLTEFNHRFTVARAYVEEMSYDADIVRGTDVPHFENARLSIQNGRLTGKSMLIEGISTTLYLDELFPLTTREMQQATISQAVFGGIALTNGNVLFQVDSPESLLIERCEWNWCDGRISSRSFSVPFQAPEIKCTAFFENISLNRLVQLLLPGKLDADGHLFGRLPINLRLAPDAALTFGKGYLYAVPSFGTMHIQDEHIIRETLVGPEQEIKVPTDIPRNELVLQALRDYRFQLLKVNFERIRENGLSGFIQLRGNGPPPYEWPVGLTIPFSVE